MNDTFSWPLEFVHNIWVFIFILFCVFLMSYHWRESYLEWKEKRENKKKAGT